MVPPRSQNPRDRGHRLSCVGKKRDRGHLPVIVPITKGPLQKAYEREAASGTSPRRSDSTIRCKLMRSSAVRRSLKSSGNDRRRRSKRGSRKRTDTVLSHSPSSSVPRKWRSSSSAYSDGETLRPIGRAAIPKRIAMVASGSRIVHDALCRATPMTAPGPSTTTISNNSPTPFPARMRMVISALCRRDLRAKNTRNLPFLLDGRPLFPYSKSSPLRHPISSQVPGPCVPGPCISLSSPRACQLPATR